MEYPILLKIKSNTTPRVVKHRMIQRVVLRKKCTFTLWKNELENGD